MSDDLPRKKDGSIDRRYLPREFGKPAPAVTQAPPVSSRDDLGQKILPGVVMEKPRYSEPPLNYIEPNGGLSTDPRFENVAADSNMLTAPVIKPVDPGTPGARVIHFMEDGFTALGKIWYRGEEFHFVEGSENHLETVNKHGISWTDMTEDEQYEKYGKRYFREGPWRGKGFEAVEFEDGEYDPEELKKLEKRRQRAASAPMRPVGA